MNQPQKDQSEANQKQLLVSLTKSRQESILRLSQLEPLQEAWWTEATVSDQALHPLATGIVFFEFQAGHPVSGRFWPNDKEEFDQIIARGMYVSNDPKKFCRMGNLVAYGDEIKFDVLSVKRPSEIGSEIKMRRAME